MTKNGNNFPLLILFKNLKELFNLITSKIGSDSGYFSRIIEIALFLLFLSQCGLTSAALLCKHTSLSKVVCVMFLFVVCVYCFWIDIYLISIFTQPHTLSLFIQAFKFSRERFQYFIGVFKRVILTLYFQYFTILSNPLAFSILLLWSII